MINLFAKNSIAGVEMDSVEIRVVELAKKHGIFRLLNAGRILLPEGAVKDGKVIKPAIVGELLSQLWSGLKIGTKEVVLGISNQEVLFRFAMFPKVALDKLDNLIRFHAQDFLPISVEEVELDYIVAGEEQQSEGMMLKVLLVAARKSMIRDFICVFETANLKIRDIDVSALSAARLLPGTANNSTVAAVNIGFGQINVLILGNGMPLFARTLPASQLAAVDTAGRGGTVLQAAVNRDTSMDEIDRIGRILVDEIQTSIGYFLSQSRDAAVDKLYLSGSGGRITGISNHLTETTGIPVEIHNPVKGMDLSASKCRLSDGDAVDYGICISLAQRGLEG